SLEGDSVGVGLGTSIATAGDVNGDHLSDVIVGASGDDNGTNVAGYAEVFLAAGPPPVAVRGERASIGELAAWPNPARGAVAIGCTVHARGRATLDVCDARGRCVARLLDET